MTIDTPISQIKNVETLIQNLMRGEITEHKKFTLDGNNMVRDKEEPFFVINLHPSHKDLYSAWEESYYTKIDSYKPIENSEKEVSCIQHTVITKLPRMLVFNIIRTHFDATKGRDCKINDRFDFDEVIFPDRYLKKNEKEANLVRDKVMKLREKVKILQESIEKFTNYSGEGGRLDSLLELTAKLIEKGNLEETEVKSAQGLELYHPDNLFKISNPNISKEKISEMVIALTISKEKA